jgi:hypothetical protein
MSSIPTPRSDSRFVRIARWCIRHRWQTLVCWVLLVVAAISLGSSVGTREIDDFRLPDTESQRAYDLLAEHAPAQNGVTDQFVYVARGGTLKDPRRQQRIEASLAQARKVPIVVDVAELSLSPDGRIGVVSVTYTDDIDALEVDVLRKVQDAGFAARGPDLQVEHGGQGAQFLRFSEQEGGPTEAIGLLAAFVVLMLTFGSLIAAGVPLLTAIFALATTLGLVPVISQVVDTPDFAPQLAALIGIGVGIDYALIVVTRYRAEHERMRARAGDPDPSADDARAQRRAMREEALLVAMDTAGRTVFFAGLTVMIALLGLLLLGLAFMQGAAIAAALAVLFTMLAALTLSFAAAQARAQADGDLADHLIGNIEAECIVDAGEMVDGDHHERERGAEALRLLDRLGQRRDQPRAVELAGQRIELGQPQQLLVACMPFIDRAHHALRARRPAIGACEPAPGLLDPDQRRGGGKPQAEFGRVGNAMSTIARRRHVDGIAADRRRRLHALGELGAGGSHLRRKVGQQRAYACPPCDGIGGDVPDELGVLDGCQDAAGVQLIGRGHRRLVSKRREEADRGAVSFQALEQLSEHFGKRDGTRHNG